MLFSPISLLFKLQKLQDEVERLGTTVRHLEALHTEKEKQLQESLTALSAAQGSAPPSHVSEATHRQEVSTLNDKVNTVHLVYLIITGDTY